MKWICTILNPNLNRIYKKRKIWRFSSFIINTTRVVDITPLYILGSVGDSIICFHGPQGQNTKRCQRKSVQV